MPRRSKGEVREWLLGVLEEMIDSPDIKDSSKLRAIDLFGTEFGLFTEVKKVKIDVNTVVRHLTDGQLTALIGDGKVVSEVKQLTDGAVDVEPLVEV